MHLSALLDFDVLPLDTDDAVSVLIDVTAPEREEDTRRPPATLQVVLDRSGSMGRGRLDGAVRALLSLVDRLAPTDNFGLVSFNGEARVEVPCGPLTDRAEVRRRIAALRASGGTDLSSGLLRGVQEARRASTGRGATLLLVSDGHANQGVTEHAPLARVARDAYAHGVTTTTLGYGLGYDEELLGALADGGAGSALFAEDPDTAGGLIAQEAEYLLAKTVQAASLRVPVGPHLRAVGVVGEMPSHRLADGSVVVELGDFHSGERRRLLLRLEVPGMSALGVTTVTTLETTYVDPETLTTYTATLPVTVNVVPGDEASGRVPRPEVRTEEALQRAQTAKREASEALRRGDRNAAAEGLERARRGLLDLPAPGAPGAPGAGSRSAAPPARPSPDVAAQVTELDRMARMARRDDAARASKTLYASQSGYSRKSGRQRGPGASPGGDQGARRVTGDAGRGGGPGHGADGTGERDAAAEGGQQGSGGRQRGGRRVRRIRGEQTDGGRPTPDQGPTPPRRES
ncbi:vWA domain-containing protein [Nocardiopsis halotolerans]|uniref:vWA domain-containing protein n=1 Tax=Nocardiopsis halotolerans TaxID=124252 RepID=UPI000349833F|nr:VWA domain-containing protein [Nocardiopsis halotolerans]